MRRRLLALLAVVAVAVPALAFAQSRILDRDDSAGVVDLASARAAHNRVTDELVWVIDLHDAFRADLLLNRDGPPGSVCVNMWTRRTPGEGAPDYDVCVTSEERGRELRATVAQHRFAGDVRRRGTADVEEASDTRLELRVDPDLIRRPRSLHWTVQAAVFSPGCPTFTGCEDFIPDRPRTSRTRLRTPR
ncbi:MAG: hypothetical protein WD844_04365 [Thermoleophilaceae bacterium]